MFVLFLRFLAIWVLCVRPFLFWASVEVALLKALHTEDIRQGLDLRLAVNPVRAFWTPCLRTLPLSFSSHLSQNCALWISFSVDRTLRWLQTDSFLHIGHGDWFNLSTWSTHMQLTKALTMEWLSQHVTRTTVPKCHPRPIQPHFMFGGGLGGLGMNSSSISYCTDSCSSVTSVGWKSRLDNIGYLVYPTIYGISRYIP